MIGQRIGKYLIVRQLGEGGMGVVYEAVREDIGSRAAIKVLRPEYAGNEEIAGRFFNEARAANLIPSPSIVQIFDYGHLPNGSAYLAMELLKGESLRARLTREEVLSESDTLWITRQVAAGLQEAHARQVIHRDLKPENVMLVPDPEAPSGERAKILDFGIAKLQSGGQNAVRTHTRALMGTPLYMSPEQCRGMKNVGDRADVYSLGVMIYEMLAGRPPFFTESSADVMAMHLSQPPEELSLRVPGLNVTLSRLVMAMLTKEPEQRPAMDAVVRSLKDFRSLSGETISKQILPRETPTVVGPLDTNTPVRPKDPNWQSVRIVEPEAAKTLPPPGKQSPAATRPWKLIGILVAIVVLIGLLIWLH